MEWFLPHYWAAALGAPAAPMTSWGWPGPAPREPAADNECTEPTALDLELIRVVYEVLVERVHCDSCGAPLHRAVNVDLPHGPTARIVVSAHCQGWSAMRVGPATSSWSG